MVGKIGAVLGVVVPMGGVIWYFAIQDADAQTEKTDQNHIEQRQEKLEEAVDTLTAIHVRQETVKEAEAKLLAKLCADGKLPKSECPGG